MACSCPTHGTLSTSVSSILRDVVGRNFSFVNRSVPVRTRAVEVRPCKPGPWRSSHTLPVHIYKGKFLSLNVPKVCTILLSIMFPAYTNPRVILLSHLCPRLPLSCYEYQFRDPCLQEVRVRTSPGLVSGKWTYPSRGPGLCSRLAWFRTLSLHSLPS
jgi:hypothetical protein